MNDTIRIRPQIRSVMIAVLIGKTRIGIRNVSATMNFARNVAMVDCQTSE